MLTRRFGNITKSKDLPTYTHNLTIAFDYLLQGLRVQLVSAAKGSWLVALQTQLSKTHLSMISLVYDRMVGVCFEY